ncbi:MAG: T9SS type A sorting domain-containing protein [Candidatus Marinimicrobia bacterium]|nr:T9SS type A sorting domain-containing protein [Candidatus Neomarinimicrobiota bacterium]
MKKFSLVFGFMLIIGLALSTSLMAVDYYVDPSGTDDGIHGSGTGTDAWKTIEYAVNHVDPTTETIVINVAAGTYNLWDGSNTDKIVIDRGFTNLTIQGAGATFTIVQAHTVKGPANDRVFNIGSDEIVTIEAMTIRYGKHATQSGGGMHLNSATLTLKNCTISGNNADGFGGGICNDSGTLTMTNCTVSGNTAGEYGGGICNYGGTLTMTNCTVSGNTNSSIGGGGLFTHNGPATITNCTFANNEATITNGGGIYFHSGNLYIKNTIIANNNSSGTADYHYTGGTLKDNGYNIVETTNVGAGSNGFTNNTNNDIVGAGTYNLSTTLKENNTTNGTYTLKTTSVSAAINAGSNSGANNGVDPPAQDQRGANRNGATDIGAYEYYDDDGSLPVELTSFTATSGHGQVTLKWTTESEIENLGFNIYRSTNPNVEFLMLNDELIPGAGNSSSRHEYEYVDKNLTNGVTYWYKLEDVDYSGNTEFHGPVSATPMQKAAPREFRLYPNYPNPFNPLTTISYDLPEEGYVELTVYNMRGEKVTTLMQGKQEAGSYQMNWDGTDRKGEIVSSGIYFLRIVSENFYKTNKMIFIR